MASSQFLPGLEQGHRKGRTVNKKRPFATLEKLYVWERGHWILLSMNLHTKISILERQKCKYQEKLYIRERKNADEHVEKVTTSVSLKSTKW